MTTRDRMVLMTLVVLAVLAGGWLLLVAPERQQAVQAQTLLTTTRQQLQTAQTQAAEARGAQAKYTTAYASLVSLGKAVPAEQEVPSLIYQLDQLSNQRNIDFNSISSGTGSAGSGGSSATSASAAATLTGFTPMPFTFVFKGSFFGLYHLLHQVDGFVVRTTANGVRVSGRLLTIQGADITLENNATGGAASERLTATITATGYVLPASQGLTGGATAAGPAGTSAAQSTSAAAAPSSPTTPAVVRSTP
jgi:type II secretory pathway pseudopilin PulG